jgi:serine/threonine protein kinase/tetratricopeptide (TPR) repeat protein
MRLGRYELVSVLGEGGMGAVWLARLRGTHGFQKLFAVKAMLPELAREERFRRMLLDEARLLARIDHANVAQVLDVGEDGGLLFVVMERVVGPSLEALCAAAGPGNRIPFRVAARIVADVCDGLHAAHELRGDDRQSLQVIHRDVTPHNILVSERGVAKLIDFGIAKARGRLAAETAFGLIKGKARYMAPEQALGQPLDRRADIWGMGAVLFRALSGRAPFAGSDELASFVSGRTSVPEVPAELPACARAVVRRALALEPEARFATAADMRSALEASLVEVGVTATVADVAAFVSKASTGGSRTTASLPSTRAEGGPAERSLGDATVSTDARGMDPRLESGEVVSDRFRIEQAAGAGGMGRVYRALDQLSGEAVAVKVLRHEGEDHARRLTHEARLLASLGHPAIVRYVAHGVLRSGAPYLVMEWVEGDDLAVRLARGPMSVGEGVALATRVAEALRAAHRVGIIHRDIKPRNLVLPADGDPRRVKVLDFGIARLGRVLALDGAPGVRSVIGTPGYMAPEQAVEGGLVDGRADIFSLGCVLFECITHRPAFTSLRAGSTLAKIVFEQAVLPGSIVEEVPPSLDRLVGRMLAKDPAARPADAEVLLSELASVARDVVNTQVVPSSRFRGITAGEQRVGSIVVVTAGAEAQGPAARVLAMIRSASSPFGARIEKLVNGVVLVCLPAQAMPSDHAAAAARCALSVRTVVPDVAMVLATGRTTASQGTTDGDAIERAMLLLAERADDPPDGALARGAIPICDVTAGLLGPRFDVRGLGGALALVGEREVVDESRSLLGKRTSFVGRERDLDTLVALFDECAREPVARAALISAPAGLGKSRLLGEFLQALASGGIRHEVWRGRGDPMRAGSPFGVVAPMLRATAGVLDGESLDSRKRKWKARLSRHVGVTDLPRVEAFLGGLVGIAYADDAMLRAARQQAVVMNDQMRRAWEDFVGAECAATPLVIAIEDLQWGDLPSIRLVDAVLRTCRERALLVVATARPDVEDVFPNLWAGREVQQVRLSALTRRACERLSREALGEAADDPTVERVVTLAAGNPFYLEELIRSVATGGGDALPETTVAMVEARLLTLEAEARRVLRAASVFGGVFWRGGLATLLGKEQRPHDLDAWLDQLVDREFLVRRGACRFGSEIEYAFRHELLRAAAYGMLTRADRELGHRLAGEWLETQGEPDALALADHYARAQQPGRALKWYHRAVEQALEGNDFAAVIARVGRAVACGAEGETLGALRLLEAESHRWRAEYSEAARAATEALQIAPRGSTRWFMAASELFSGERALARHNPGLVEEMLATEYAEDATAARTIALSRAAVEDFVNGVPELRQRLLAELRRLEGAVRDEPLASACLLGARAVLAGLEGDPEGRVRLFEQSLASLERAGDLRGSAIQHANLSSACNEIGDYARATEFGRRSLAVATTAALPSVMALAKSNLGFALGRSGHLDEARRFEAESAEAFLANGLPRMSAWSRGYLVDIVVRAGDLAEAERQASDALATAAGYPDARAYVLCALARVLLRRGLPADALSRSSEAMALLEAQGEIEEGEAAIRLTHAEALHAAGDAAQAGIAIGIARDRLVARAAKMKDDLWRSSFLKRVEENRRTMDLADAWLGGRV